MKYYFWPTLLLLTVLGATTGCFRSWEGIISASNQAFYGHYTLEEVHYQADWDGSTYLVDTTYTFDAELDLQEDAQQLYWGQFVLSNHQQFHSIRAIPSVSADNGPVYFSSTSKDRLKIIAQRAANDTVTYYTSDFSVVVDVLTLNSNTLEWSYRSCDPISGEFWVETVRFRRDF